MTRHWMDSAELTDELFAARDRRIAALTARLSEAEAIIDELNAHEGAEGWSADLKERLTRFYATKEKA